MCENNNRYKVNIVTSKSLEGNPLESPIERELNVYLPPDYFDVGAKKYPVIYFIHGYDGNSKNLPITPRWNDNPNLPIELIPPDLLKMIEKDKIASYVKFDELIEKNEWNPFILVQPDASLHIPHYMGIKTLTGMPVTKGSFYINSKTTGNYVDYIVKDIIEYTDAHYRTIADKNHRALIGTSMGGYGALNLGTLHPEKFASIVALGPANLFLEFLDHQMISPLNVALVGEEEAKVMGAQSLHDIFDTLDLIVSKERPLLPSIKRDESENVLSMDEVAARNWKKHDIKNLIKEHPNAFKDVKLMMICHKKDEFGLAKETTDIHEVLLEKGIDHEFKIVVDARANIAPHMLGIGYQILPAINFCLNNIK